MKSYNIKNILALILKMVRYNLKIIFANRFIWFFLFSLAFFIGISILFVYEGNTINEATVYGILLFPGILLIFYPAVFGIQNDQDSGMLEILFGIPNYRYKVWLVRLLMTFVQIYIFMLLYAWIASLILVPVNPFEMAYQLMFPVVFMGGLAFMLSTVIKNGNGTAVVMALLGVGLLILSEQLERTQWNIVLNPFNLPDNFNQVIWEGIIIKNRIFLSVGILVTILYGLFNLQKREKFV